jgi:hypothetical protein
MKEPPQLARCGGPYHGCLEISVDADDLLGDGGHAGLGSRHSWIGSVDRRFTHVLFGYPVEAKGNRATEGVTNVIEYPIRSGMQAI